MKSLAFTSFFTNKTTKDTNEPWPSYKNQIMVHSPSNCDGEQNVFVKKITDEHDATVDFSREVGLTKSDRLFFEPGYSTKSIMEEALLHKKNDSTLIGSFRGGVAMAMESRDPYRDFRESMEQMVMAHRHGVRDWDWLQEMLGWYLRANGKRTHGMILGAFVDLLTSLTKSDSSNLSNHISSCSSNCSCFSFEIEDNTERPHNN